ncbi:RNA exonuclease 4, partial [Smittium culicis]
LQKRKTGFTDDYVFEKIIGSGDNAPKSPKEWFIALAKAEQYMKLSSIKKKVLSEGYHPENDQNGQLAEFIKNPDKFHLSEHLSPIEKQKAIGNYLAIDCEMVGCGFKGRRSVLARVSIVNFNGMTILDLYAKPEEPVVDYRTWVSGIRPSDLENAESFSVVQAKVKELIKDRILIGHAIHNDLEALKLRHHPEFIRDTTSYTPFRDHVNGGTPGLRKLSQLELGLAIQQGEHSSVIDAQITMLLFRKVRAKWNNLVKKKQKVKSKRIERGIKKAAYRQKFAKKD